MTRPLPIFPADPSCQQCGSAGKNITWAVKSSLLMMLLESLKLAPPAAGETSNTIVLVLWRFCIYLRCRMIFDMMPFDSFFHKIAKSRAKYSLFYGCNMGVLHSQYCADRMIKSTQSTILSSIKELHSSHFTMHFVHDQNWHFRK